MKEQIILITGASSGIGKETALKLAKSGHKVFAGVRKKADKNLLESLHENITSVYIDVTDVSSVDNAVLFIKEKTKKIDVLINNAGTVVASPIEFIDINRLKEQFNVNTFGAVLVVQKFMPLLDNAKIINMSSVASTGLFPYISPYCASKRALDILMNSFYIENKNNIKVISIKPSAIKTPIWEKSIKRCEEDFNCLNEICRKKYQKEFDYLKNKAYYASEKGIDVKKVVRTIEKVINSKNPKSSYNVGSSAVLSEWVSKLSQNTINSIIKFFIKCQKRKNITKSS